MRRRCLPLVAAVGVGWVGVVGTAAGSQGVTAAPMVIRETLLDPATDTVTIVGEHFGTRVFATLDLVPVEVRLSIDTRVVLAVPLAAMPPNNYLLTLSRGPLPADSASTVIAIGGGPVPTTPAPSRSDLVLETGPPAATDVAARVGERVFTVADVDREWQRTDSGTYAALMQELHEHRRRITDQMVTDELLRREAAARATTPEQLLADELPKRSLAVPDSAVSALYSSLGDRARGASLDQMRPSLRAWLERHTEPELARMAFVEELTKTSTQAQVLLPAPRLRLQHSPLDPVLGKAAAPVSVVVFGDLQSPDYARMAPAFATIRETFGDRISVTFKLLPMFGAQSAPIAEAAQCAHAQGRFWAYHDAALKPGVLDAARMSALVAEAGLARGPYEACIAGGAYRTRAVEARADAERYGIARAPTVVVNGRIAPEPPPFLPPAEYLTRLIEEELQRQRVVPAKGD